MSENASGYDATNITVLEGREAIRKRPGMYVGSTGIRGLHQVLFEVIGRSVNDVLADGGGCVDVTLMRDGGVRVTDDGPGVPVEAAGDTSNACLETLLTRTQPGAGPGDRHRVSWSVCGMGPCVTNALSRRLTAEVRRGQTLWIQEYSRGAAVAPPAATGPATGSGTSIAFWPDADIFDTTDCSFGVLAKRFREVALLNRGLSISLTDERPPGGVRSVRFQYPDGPRDFVAFLDAETGAQVAPDIIAFEREDARMAGTVEVALSWCGRRDEEVRSFANSVPTLEGGTHADGFRTGVTAAVNTHARQRRLVKMSDPDLTTDRISRGLTAVVSVKLDSPEYQGATRARLGGGATVHDCVEQAVREHLGTWLAQHPEQAAAIIARIVQETSRN
ncbi:DNA gyrase subunit B [Streptomyces sp. NBC_00683]|uniref:DNA gyrase subunit B n=1 Tax=Streptomyces sp. NBC_00683 TaxID=2903670 RepID=UPI002E325EF6|nr:DNA gyrase subunit B [Streptomyces sp. NBC_00683]